MIFGFSFGEFWFSFYSFVKKTIWSSTSTVVYQNIIYFTLCHISITESMFLFICILLIFTHVDSLFGNEDRISGYSDDDLHHQQKDWHKWQKRSYFDLLYWMYSVTHDSAPWHRLNGAWSVVIYASNMVFGSSAISFGHLFTKRYV